MPSRANYVLTILVIVYVFNFIDRQILSILLLPIQQELGVSDAAMGFLTGVAFALFYTTAGIPIARWADRGSRVSIIALGLALWSGMTALSGLARSYLQLAIARVLVGVGEAAASPASHSLISDYFPPERRATALAIYTIGANIGILIGLVAGGWINEYFGWRTAFFVVGLPGIAMALVVKLTVREPPRGAVEGLDAGEAVPSVREVLRHLGSLPAFRHLALAAGIYAFAGYGFVTWVPTFLIRVQGMGTGEAGTWTGLLIGGGGALGAYVGGRLCDGLGPRDVRWQMWIPALGAAAVVPLAAVFLLSPHAHLGLAAYLPAVVAGAFYIGPTYAMTQALARLRMRALAAAIVLFILNLIGLGLGPWAVGFASDLWSDVYGVGSIRYALLAAAGVNLWGVVHSLLAARTLERDLARVDSAGG